MDATALFADRAAEYARCRLGYPPEVVDAAFALIALAPTDVIADLGSGTGLLARQFLDRGNRVLGVEPDAGMRQAAEASLSGFGARFVSVVGRAERTSLGPGTVNVVAAGNALHLFDPSAAPAEARRILASGGRALVIGHDFAATPNPFMRAYATFVADVAAADVAVFHAPDRAAVALEAFFADCKRHERDLGDHIVELDWDRLRGRFLSTSGAPRTGDPRRPEVLARLGALFDTYAQNGTIPFQLRWRLAWGTLGKR